MIIEKLENELRELEFHKYIAKDIQDKEKEAEIEKKIQRLIKKIKKELGGK